MLRRLSALSTLLLLVVTVARAQFEGMQLPNVEYNPLLLINASVQKELKLSPTKAANVQNAFMEEAMKIVPIMTNQSQAQGAKPLTPQQKSKAMLAGVVKMQERLAAMLTPGQRVRLRELTLQSIGPSAVLQPKVATALGLSSTQRSSLMTSLSAANQSIARGKLSSQGDWQLKLKEMSRLQAAAKEAGNRALAKTLTAGQKTKWQSMLGKPFPLTGFMGVGNTLPMGG